MVAAVLRVAVVTAGLVESKAAGFMTHITYRLTAKNRDQLQNPTLGNRVWAAFFTTSIVVVRTYPSLEPLTEPHRLVVCLHCAVTTTTIATTTTCIIVVVVVRTYPSLMACLHRAVTTTTIATTTTCIVVVVVVRTYPSLMVCLHSAVTTTTIATTITCIVVVVVRTYPSLETLTEPHRLVACLHCTVSVARSMLAGGRWYPEGRLHVIPLMTVSLPGIDPNDIRKSLVC